MNQCQVIVEAESGFYSVSHLKKICKTWLNIAFWIQSHQNDAYVMLFELFSDYSHSFSIFCSNKPIFKFCVIVNHPS